MCTEYTNGKKKEKMRLYSPCKMSTIQTLRIKHTGAIVSIHFRASNCCYLMGSPGEGRRWGK